MIFTVDQLKQYAFCPKFYEQDGKFSELDRSNNMFKDLVTYLFRRDLETSSKQTWKDLEKRWKKIFFSEFQVDDDTVALYHSSLIPLHKFHKWYLEQSSDVLGVNHSFEAFVYGHHVKCDAPVLIHSNSEVEIICVVPFEGEFNIFYDPMIRYLGVVLFEETNDNVSKISNISLWNFKHFYHSTFEPNVRYWDSSTSDLANLMQSMSSKLSYPNTASCKDCTLKVTCEVMKGNE